MSGRDDEMRHRREAMVREVEQRLADVAPSVARGSPLSPRVAAALRAVPRHRFVPEEQQADAYLNQPLPIGYGQTISQPLIVALMTELLDLSPDARVLEIGTGCGYQTAVLAHLARDVHTIEIVAPLAERARRTFDELGLANITARTGDGHEGWPEAAPFDAILVTAAPDRVPEALVSQLKPGGRLAMPIGTREQKLIVVEKLGDQSTSVREIIPVSFVPLTREKPHRSGGT